MKRWVAMAGIVILTLFFTDRGFGQTWQTQPPAPPPFKEAVVDINAGHIKGDKDAKFVIIEFSEYQCPFCGRFVRETMPQIQKDYIDT